jgi:plasmid stability protein
MSALNAPKTVTTTKDETLKAATIYEYTHISASSLLSAYDLARAKRGAPRGASTDAEQDILRAMLVMGAGGIDSLVKQLMRDCLPKLVVDQGARTELEKFVQRQLKAEVTALDPAGSRFLSTVLASPNHHHAVVEQYIRDLTGDSLQSSEQVFKAATALGADGVKLGFDKKKLTSIFDIRNAIVHELDIDLDGSRRKRNQRKVEDMIGHTDALLKVGETLIESVDKRI